MLDQTLQTALAEQRIVGAISVVLRNGKPIYETAVGLADREENVPMTLSTPHRLASLTKPVVAAGVMALVDRGKLELGTTVDRYTPLRPLTIHQLLTHTSGLSYPFMEPPDGPYHRANVSNGLDQPGLSIDENLRRLATVPPSFTPGTAWGYSLSFDVLGAVIEKICDAPLGDALFDLLGVDLSFAPRSGLATPYYNAPGAPLRMFDGVAVPTFPPLACTFAPSRVYDPASYPSGGAGMVGTAHAFAAFLEALRTRRVPVRRALVDQMFLDHIPALDPPALNGYGNGYGFAVRRDQTPSPLGRGAVRWGGAYGHSWFISGDVVSVLLTNTSFEGMSGRLRDEVERDIMGM